MFSDARSCLTLWEDEQSAFREELWEEMSKKEYLGKIVLCKGDIIFFIYPGTSLKPTLFINAFWNLTYFLGNLQVDTESRGGPRSNFMTLSSHNRLRRGSGPRKEKC